jgi:TRAP-type C4-dicarboxylate transport system permease small subunit
MKLLSKILGLLHKFLVTFQAVLLGVLLLMVSYQIISRWVFFLPRILWTEEISRFLLVWVIFLGAGIGIKENTHFVLDLLSYSKSKVFNLAWDLFVLALNLSFTFIFLIRGYKYAAVLLWDTSDIAQISMLWVGISIPIFGALGTVFFLEILAKRIAKGVK